MNENKTVGIKLKMLVDHAWRITTCRNIVRHNNIVNRSNISNYYLLLYTMEISAASYAIIYV